MRHENNFDLVRFALAFTVFLVHTHVLSEQVDLSWFSMWLSSDIAVKGFFVVSGYLVFMSYENARSVRDYLEKRARRIYPAYFTVILACAVAGTLFTRQALSEYFSADFVRYVAANLVFLNFLAPSLPGLFESNSWQAVNGALWTLKIEVMFYLCVPLIAWIASRWHRPLVMVLIYLLSVAYSVTLLTLAKSASQPIYELFARQLPGQMTYFVVGAAYYYYRDILAPYRNWLLLAAAAAYLIGLGDAAVAVEPLALGTIIVYFATHLRYLGNFGRFGDFSYGVYIVHFPIVQTLVALGLFRQSAALGLLVSTVLVLVAAYLSWHLVEKPWLRKSSHYVIASSAPEQR